MRLWLMITGRHKCALTPLTQGKKVTGEAGAARQHFLADKQV